MLTLVGLIEPQASSAETGLHAAGGSQEAGMLGVAPDGGPEGLAGVLVFDGTSREGCTVPQPPTSAITSAIARARGARWFLALAFVLVGPELITRYDRA